MGIFSRRDKDVRLIQKLEAKHNDLFKKIVFAQRDDKQDLAKSYVSELVQVRKMMDMQKHAHLKLKWKMYR